MRPKGLIYQSGKSAKTGVVVVQLSRVSRAVYGFVRGLGAGMIALGVLGLAFTFGPIAKEELVYNLNYLGVIDSKPYDTGFIAQADKVSAVQKEAADYGVDSYFSLVIPKIDASSKVVANVSLVDKEQYLSALKKGIAHGKGTYFPGQGKPIFVFSHSTDSPINIAQYNAEFYLLRKLEANDKIIVFFADEKYEYVVVDKFTTAANDLSWLDPTEAEEKLILMTCDPPGTTWRRLLVVAKPMF